MGGQSWGSSCCWDPPALMLIQGAPTPQVLQPGVPRRADPKRPPRIGGRWVNKCKEDGNIPAKG